MSDKTSPDPFIDAEVESTVAPLRAMGFSPALLLEVERTLRLALTSHPAGQYLVQQLRPRHVEESGPTATGDLDHLDGAEAEAGRGR
jgi:hypothetical protein